MERDFSKTSVADQCRKTNRGRPGVIQRYCRHTDRRCMQQEFLKLSSTVRVYLTSEFAQTKCPRLPPTRSAVPIARSSDCLKHSEETRQREPGLEKIRQQLYSRHSRTHPTCQRRDLQSVPQSLQCSSVASNMTIPSRNQDSKRTRVRADRGAATLCDDGRSRTRKPKSI